MFGFGKKKPQTGKAPAEEKGLGESGSPDVVEHIQVQRFNSLNPHCAITLHRLVNTYFGTGYSERQFEIEEIRLALDNDYARCRASRFDPGLDKSIENILSQIAQGIRSFEMKTYQTENHELAGWSVAVGFVRKIVFGLGPGLSSNGPDEARVYALSIIGNLAEMFEAEPPKTFLRGAGILFECFLAEHLDEFPMPTPVKRTILEVKVAFDQWSRSKDLLETTLWSLVESLCEGKTPRIKGVVYQELEDRIGEVCEENADEIKKLSDDIVDIAECVPWEGSENAPTSKQSLKEWKEYDAAMKKWKGEVFRRLSH